MRGWGRRHRDERGLVGKFIVGWLLLVVLLGVAAVDFGSIAFTTFRLSDIATSAAAEAASQLDRGATPLEACSSAEAIVAEQDPAVRLVGCRRGDGRSVSVTVRKKAATLIVGRLEFLERYGRVTRTESASAGVV
jgi:uncharacterized membrane protein